MRTDNQVKKNVSKKNAATKSVKTKIGAATKPSTTKPRTANTSAAIASASASAVRPHRSPDEFDAWVSVIAKHVAAMPNVPLFLTEPAEPLFDLYLNSFSGAARQTHNCNSCRHFLERFGSLVMINERGGCVPLFWDFAGVPTMYKDICHRLALEVWRSPIVGVFLSGETTWGDGPKAPKQWTHFQVKNRARFTHPLKTASQSMAEKREERNMLERGLAEFSIDVVRQAVAILKTEQLYRSEKVLGVGEWLLALHEKIAGEKNRQRRDNLVWLAVATAPAGFAHVRSSMIGTLLEDLASGMQFEDVKRRFADKMHPLQYQRPTAAPSEGNIEQAEKVVASLQSAGALERRFAKLEDLTTLWTPRPAKPSKPAASSRSTASSGVFAHLRGSQKLDVTETGAPPTAMTWEKFARTVLPTAERIEYMVPRYSAPLLAFVTAANADAPPIVQWDREDKRNPVTWYQYINQSAPSRWNLRPDEWCAVTAITLGPFAWDAARDHGNHGHLAVLILDGARDLHYVQSGGLFPEHLKGDYHSVRRTLEAHFMRSTIVGKNEATACGLALQGNGPWNATVRVTAGGVRTLYRIDRWD